jgi:hypothetical protein
MPEKISGVCASCGLDIEKQNKDCSLRNLFDDNEYGLCARCEFDRFYEENTESLEVQDA